MRFIRGAPTTLIIGVVVLASSVSAQYNPKIEVVRNGKYPLNVVDKLEESLMPKVETWLNKKIAAKTNNNCTIENAKVRREWGDLTVSQRLDYVAAVKCLMKKPATANKTKYPGAISRFDDFVAFHVTHAGMLHNTNNLFTAHRYFLYVYEEALRNECGYKGYHPYMDYDRYTKNDPDDPMFNGNASSMGGNGAYDPNYKGVPQMGRTPSIIKSGGGGGCMTEGPFKDMVVSLGPVMSRNPSVPKNPRSDGLGSNPRCIRRDINRDAAMGATAKHQYDLVTEKTVNGFYNRLLGQPAPKNDPYPWGIHTAGHYIFPVDPGGDPSTSPGDPVFYFHHGMLDRLWWIWQMQDPETRLSALPTVGHSHKQRRADPMESMIDLEWLAPPIKLKEAMDQLGGNGGKFCYIYI
ncbi:Di-copper centre-containing protein [Microthyrium microscopicum]|uniref:Di-copper centre-containing protein n=1 Tax=Microthyrium microscopicum TaxID=703497 RepID=A0A6A6U8W6_9PEZI|nr:Di-copper centre-containing protein [Microthyrium microscopicum]